MFQRSSLRSLLFALAALAVFVPVALAGDKKAKVADAWGKEVEVSGYDDAKNPGSEWFVHDPARPQPKLADPKDIKPNLNAKPPAGAVVLFDGANLDAWTNPKWKIEDGVAIIGGGSLNSKESFGSAHYHLEWSAPIPAKGNGQGRGNSGVIIMGKYEIQVLDCWHNATYPDGMTASVYGQNPPSVNAAVPPGEWNSYDIEFHAPKFSSDGKLEKPARVTVIWNGVKVQDNFELVGAVSHRGAAKYSAHPAKLPLHLQDHGNPVRFRNIWVKPIAD